METDNLQYLFRLLKKRGEKVVPLLSRVVLKHCRSADVEHEKRWRQFMHFNHHPNTICYAAASAQLSDEHKIGLLAHELGHAAARYLGLWENHDERDAQRLGSAMLGSMVLYRGSERLEWAVIPAWLKQELGV